MTSTFAVTGVTTSAVGLTLKLGDTLGLTLAAAETIDSVTLAGGVLPTLQLSNGATATYTGFDTAGLHFAYTVASGQDAANLAVTSLSLNGADVAHAGTSSFATQVAYATGSYPSSVATADVNGDGKADLLTANNIPNTASVLLGNGDGTFQTKQDFATGTTPYSVATADVNGDGKADLVTTNLSSDSVSVLLGNGDGTFQARQDYGVGPNPYFVTTADVNGDGRVDLITASNASPGTVSVLLGNGDGTFQAKQDFATGYGPIAVATADVNGDGKADLVTANSGGSVSVLLGNGDGTFQANQDYGLGSAAYSVAAADLNGDGKADLVIAHYGANTVSVLLGNGDGTFQARTSYATGAGPFSVATTDVNGDGKADLVTANYGANTVSVLLGNGDGTFQARTDYVTGSHPRSVATVDLNGDGQADLVAANLVGNSVSVLMNNGSPAGQLDATSLTTATGTATGLDVDTTAPTVASLAVGAVSPTNATSLTYTLAFSEAVTGVDASDVTVTTVSGTAAAHVASVTGSGTTYTVTVDQVAGDGALRLDLKASGTGIQDAAGNTAPGFTSGTSTILDHTAPSVAISAIAGDDVLNGAEALGAITIAGTAAGAEDGRLVTIAIKDVTGTTTYASATAAVAGEAWSLSLPAGTGTQLPDRSYTVTADVSDRAGNPAAEVQRTLVVDKFADQPPSATLVLDGTADHVVNAAEAGAVTFTVAGLDTDAQATATFTDGIHTRSVQVTADGTGSVNLSGFNGSVTGSLAITDVHTNTALAAGNTLVLDTVGPSAPTPSLTNDTGASPSDRVTSDPTITYAASAAGDTLLYAADGGASSTTAPTITGDGQHTVSLVERDPAGNLSGASSLTFTLDTTAPATPTLALANDTGASSTDRVTSDPTITYAASAAGDTLLYAADGGASSTTAPTFATDGSADGQHTVLVAERDGAGNVSAVASLTFTLDTSAPVQITDVSGAANLVGGHFVSGLLNLAHAGLAVTIRDGDTVLGTVASDADGHFELAVTAIDDGSGRTLHFSASVTETAGHTETSGVVDYALDFTPNLNLFGALTSDAASVGGQVYALYDGLLGRAPDTLGFSYWTDRVAHGDSLHDVAASLLASGEFAAGNGGPDTSGSDDAFVQHIYTTALGRPADAGGEAYWDGQLATGISRADVALSLALSSENAGQIAPALQAGIFVPDATAGAVARLYDAAFGRDPDGTGLASWTGAAKAGASLDTIMSSFLHSAEGVARHPAGETDGAFLQSVYAGVLGRPADTGGLAYWGDVLAGGVSRAAVATIIAESPEARAHLVGHVEAGWQLA